MEYMNEMISQKAKDVAVFIASTAGAEQRPLRLRRTRLDQQRHTYGKSASSTEKLLSDVEAGVEELRNEVVERRWVTISSKLESLLVQLQIVQSFYGFIWVVQASRSAFERIEAMMNYYRTLNKSSSASRQIRILCF